MPFMQGVYGLQKQLFDELDKVRKKGLSSLDVLDRKGVPEVATPLLDEAAKRVPKSDGCLTRSALIEQLIDFAITRKIGDPCTVWLPASFGMTEQTRGK